MVPKQEREWEIQPGNVVPALAAGWGFSERRKMFLKLLQKRQMYKA